MQAPRGVTTGLDRLLQAPQAWLRGRRFGLVTNRASRTAGGTPAAEALAAAVRSQLAALLAPEHGLDAGAPAGQAIDDGVAGPGLPVISLYRPELPQPDPAGPEELGLQALVLDLQDAGVRCYTYLATMLACLRASAAQGLVLLVLDRPNPLGGWVVEGPGVEPGFGSMVGPADLPWRHGLTLGELARLAASRQGLPPESLEVVAMEGWDRRPAWPGTGLAWYPPSPNLRSPHAAAAYPATVMVEGTNLSEGRGTLAPFELVGAPWIDPDRLVRGLAMAGPRGPMVSPASFVPSEGQWAGVQCHGVRLAAPAAGITLTFAYRLLRAARDQAPDRFVWVRSRTGPGRDQPAYHLDLLAGGAWLRQAVESGAGGEDGEALREKWRGYEAAFRAEAAPHLLYGGPDRWAAAGSPRPPGRALDQAGGTEIAERVVASAARAVAAVDATAGELGRVIEAVAAHLGRTGGRLVYAGAGTSGRLGLLDAAECGPTFGVPPGQVLGLLAGGREAGWTAREGAEDDTAAAAAEVEAAGLGPADVLVGISASGTTPYTLAAVECAARRGALTVGVACAGSSPLARAAAIGLEVPTGPEPLEGSTRLGAGTAQKVICNAISTGVFARLGYVYGGRMVGVQPLNAKLYRRAVAIVADLAQVDPAVADRSLAQALATDRRQAVRLAVLSLRAGVSMAEAARRLEQARGNLRAALEPDGGAAPAVSPAGPARAEPGP